MLMIQLIALLIGNSLSSQVHSFDRDLSLDDVETNPYLRQNAMFLRCRTRHEIQTADEFSFPSYILISFCFRINRLDVI
jgi:hypothetical protein